jgi:hypothetical protein
MLIGLVVLAACDTPVRESNPIPSLARSGSGPSVAATDPTYGKRGAISLGVHVLGSGFDAGSQASWQRNGVADPKIHVQGTTFVSSSELVAVIDIASDADLALYDVAVTTSSGRKGIGTELFVVTSINLLPQLDGIGQQSTSLGVNDAGQIVGRSRTEAFFWSAAGGIEDLGAGEARDLNAGGTTVVGSTSTSTDGMPRIWTGGSGSWTGASLPVSCVNGTVTGGVARAITNDGSVVGGLLRVQGTRKNSTFSIPVLWNLGSGGCRVLPLPAGFSGARVTDVNGLGMATGSGIVWNADASFTVLGPLPGETSAFTEGISEDGTIAVGYSGLRAAYWVRSGATWSSAIELPVPVSCSSAGSWANDVTTGGIIVGKGCDGGAWYWTLSAGVLTSTNRLLGTGAKSSGAAEAVNGVTTGGLPWIAGGSSDQAAYWVRP